MNETGLAGEAIGAGLSAGAIERERLGSGAVGRDGHTHESKCLNCGTALVGPYCGACGQGAHVHRTLVAFFHDLLHGVFHFEGRVWHTLPMLVLDPGALTRRYIDGQRVRFVSPLALFLFCVFVMFASMQQTATGLQSDLAVKRRDVAQSQGEITRALSDLRRERAERVRTGAATADLDTSITTLSSVSGALPAMTTRPEAVFDIRTGIAPVDAAASRVRENPALALYKLESHAYKYSWLLIPISVPMVWLLFPFSRRFAIYDHTVFVTYSLCFMTLLTVAIALAGRLGAGGAAGLLACTPPLHMFMQLRGAYGCSVLGAALRTLALLTIAGLALTIWGMLILAESLRG